MVNGKKMLSSNWRAENNYVLKNGEILDFGFKIFGFQILGFR